MGEHESIAFSCKYINEYVFHEDIDDSRYMDYGWNELIYFLPKLLVRKEKYIMFMKLRRTPPSTKISNPDFGILRLI